MRLYLIRHGETEWSLSGRHTGQTDLSLTPHGAEQARRLSTWLRNTEFTRVLTSPLQRARQTCELAGLSGTAEADPELAEWDYGTYEGQSSADIRRDRPGWNVFRDGCPGGESPGKIGDRADRVLARLAQAQGNTALFSHGQFGSVLAARWIGQAVASGQHFVLDSASLNILGNRPNHSGIRAILLWNATTEWLPGSDCPMMPQLQISDF